MDRSEPPSEATSTPEGPIWQYKPWWCQPWSILLTGGAGIVASWLLFQRWWITAPVVLAVLVWWGLFLVLLPAAWKQAQTLQRAKDFEA